MVTGLAPNQWGRMGGVLSGTHTHYERNADMVLDRACAFVVGCLSGVMQPRT